MNKLWDNTVNDTNPLFLAKTPDINTQKCNNKTIGNPDVLTYRQAKQSPDWNKFQISKTEEVQNFCKNGIWSIVERSKFHVALKYYEWFGHFDVKQILSTKYTDCDHASVLMVVNKRKALTTTHHIAL